MQAGQNTPGHLFTLSHNVFAAFMPDSRIRHFLPPHLLMFPSDRHFRRNEVCIASMYKFCVLKP